MVRYFSRFGFPFFIRLITNVAIVVEHAVGALFYVWNSFQVLTTCKVKGSERSVCVIMCFISCGGNERKGRCALQLSSTKYIILYMFTEEECECVFLARNS